MDAGGDGHGHGTEPEGDEGNGDDGQESRDQATQAHDRESGHETAGEEAEEGRGFVESEWEEAGRWGRTRGPGR